MAGITLQMANVQLQMAEMLKQARKFSQGSWCTVGFHAEVKSIRKRVEHYKNAKKQWKTRLKAPESTKPEPSNAEVAAWNHFGTENIPARPFLDVAIVKNKDLVAKAAEEVLQKGGSVSKAVDAMGSKAAGSVSAYMADVFIPPPNSPATIEQKHSSHPLIDSSQLRQAVSWQRTKK